MTSRAGPVITFRKTAGLVAMAVLALLLCAISINAFRASEHRLTAERWHVHTLDVLLTTGELKVAVLSELRGERGYLVTGDRSFLDPYFQGRRDALIVVERLATLTTDNPEQARRANALMAEVALLNDLMERTIALQRAGRGDAALDIVKHKIGKTRVDAILRILGMVEREERRLLTLRAADAAQAMRISNRYAYALSAIGLITLIAAGLAVVRVRRARREVEVMTAELQLRAATDDLTGLANRREFMAALTSALAAANRHHRPLALAIVDLDHFKRINDTLGHPAGDDVLRHFAELAGQTMRAGDIVGRLGGEEFGVLMPETDAEQAQTACERLRETLVREPIALAGGASVHATASSGVAVRRPGETSESLILRADTALYEAKHGGRDQVRLAA